MEMVDMVDDKTWINVEESADGDGNSDGVGDGASGGASGGEDNEIDGWEAFDDDISGETYYFCASTGICQWEVPKKLNDY